jgi:hypothetical protein
MEKSLNEDVQDPHITSFSRPVPQRTTRLQHGVMGLSVSLIISENELEDLIKRAIVSTLTERSDLLENAVTEAILDMKLGIAIEEGDTGEYVDEEQIRFLHRKEIYRRFP